MKKALSIRNISWSITGYVLLREIA